MARYWFGSSSSNLLEIEGRKPKVSRINITPVCFSFIMFGFHEELKREDKLWKLLYATCLQIHASGTEYSNELTYRPGMALRSANCAALEKGGMQVRPKEDIKILNLCKRMMERGECPPLMVVFDPVEGFTVQADRYIKDLTIITEYVGDVDYLKNRENEYVDSMTLLHAPNPSRSLIICPDKRRFVNGINNFSPDGRKKQNLKCMRYDVNGECRVLLVANRDIRKGEGLYYDCNGYEHEYPTEHFV